MKKILIVCKGNICRSPIADGLLRKKFAARNLHEVYVDSCGTGHWHIGKHPDLRAIEVAKEHGLDISALRSRQFQQTDFAQFDYIYTMDEENRARVLSMATSDSDQEKVIPITIFSSQGKSRVSDPYHHGQDQFEQVFQELDQITSALVHFMELELRNPSTVLS